MHPEGANALTTEHFRVLWGDAYDRTDPEWTDQDADGVPIWVEVLAEALEEAHVTQAGLGFAEPYGANRYYLDVYVANTGLRLLDKDEGSVHTVTIGQHYFAYTDIDSDSGVAYFVFSDDFSGHVSDELTVLRATAAHELFHAVQRTDYPWDNEVRVPDPRWDEERWWFEATATWMEEVCEPDADDYVHYVQHFLDHPEVPLTSANGLREYGAAIFAGYLWLERGGPSLWQDIFYRAFENGLENAMESALQDTGEPPLAEVIPAFWALAAHPEDTWPDGARFCTPSAPRLLLSASQLPLRVSTSTSDGPGRFGADLVRIDAFEGTLLAAILQSQPGTDWSIAVSSSGSSEALVITPNVGGRTVPLLGDGSQPTYVAVVNTSGGPVETGPYWAYRALFTGSEGGDELAVATPESDSSSGGGGGGGGCFIGLLGPL